MEPETIDKSHTISVKVIDPQPDANKGFYTYLIMGNDELGTFEIRRRYNDFFYLRQTLKKKWPGLFIPPIPQKKLIGGKDQHQVEYRRKFFNYFLEQLGRAKNLFYSPATQQFLRTKGSDMEKYYQTVAVPKMPDLVMQYKKLYPELNYKAHQAEFTNTSNTFFQFLKKAEKDLKLMANELGGVVASRNVFMENLNNCNTTMLPQYEKNVYSEYLGESKRQPVLLFVHDHKVQDNIRNLRDYSVGKPNPFQLFYDMIIYESKEVEAFQEAILAKEALEANKKKLQEKCLSNQAEVAKLIGGKTTFKSFFSKGSKNEQIQTLEKQIPELQKQIEGTAELCEIINAIISSEQIPSFKTNKQKQYYELLATTSDRELTFLAAYGTFMKSVMDGLSKTVVMI